MSNQLRVDYDNCQEQYREATNRTAEAKFKLDEAQATFDDALEKEQAAERELAKLREALDQALAAASQPPIVQRAPSEPTPPTSADDKIRPSVRATIHAFPRDGGDISLGDLREHFGLSEGAVNTRIQKAKAAGLVKSVGWGRYALTDKGKRAVSNLRVISSAKSEG